MFGGKVFKYVIALQASDWLPVESIPTDAGSSSYPVTNSSTVRFAGLVQGGGVGPTVIIPVPANVQSVNVTLPPLNKQPPNLGVSVVLVVVVGRAVLVVVVVGGSGTISPATKSKSSQHPLSPE